MSQPSSELMIEARAVEKWYPNGFQALRGASLTVRRGEVVVIMGPSGSGKSTFIRTFNALEDFQKGSITVDGIVLSDDLRNIDAVRREVGMVFQQFNLFPHLSVLDNLTLAPVLVRKRPKAEVEQQAWALLERVGIAEQAGKYPGQLSGASSSGWRSPGPSAWSPASCCSMNPPAPSTRRWCGRCWR